MQRLVERLESLLLRPAWWIWPVMMVITALVADTAALILVPRTNELCYFFDMYQFGGQCDFTTLTGLPCPNCGMTRSFVHGIRFNWIDAFFYNPAGFALFLWINVGGLLGTFRLATKDPNRLTLSPNLFMGWVFFWLFALYALGFILRLFGINALH